MRAGFGFRVGSWDPCPTAEQRRDPKCGVAGGLFLGDILMQKSQTQNLMTRRKLETGKIGNTFDRVIGVIIPPQI